MKIALAQTRPLGGDVEKNLDDHLAYSEKAAMIGCTLIVFPELSLLGYEPTLASAMAMDIDDRHLLRLQQQATDFNISIVAGFPWRRGNGTAIAQAILSPGRPARFNTKKFLHADELPWFVSGDVQQCLELEKLKIALPICYEISIPETAATAAQEGVHIYLASVAKSVKGVVPAMETMSALAQQHGFITMMANCVGHCDDFDCGGSSAVWQADGKLIDCLNQYEEGLLIFDTQAGVCTKTTDGRTTQA